MFLLLHDFHYDVDVLSNFLIKQATSHRYEDYCYITGDNFNPKCSFTITQSVY